MARRRAKQIQRIQPGSEEMERFLGVGYQMTKEEAERIIKERDKDPHLWPFEVYQKAKAFLAALDATPEVVSTRPGWKRTKPSQ